MAYTSFFRVPRPRSFLYLMSLRTGTQLIALSLLINKISGLYGILALLTGLHLSPLQLSMYIYSIIALIITCILVPHIRKQSPMQCIALAWFYLLDSIINAAYTLAFGLGWFLVLAQHNSPLDGGSGSGPGANGNAPGGKMIDSAAGFTNPKYNVSRVEVVATPNPTQLGQDATIYAAGSDGAPGPNPGALQTTFLESGSIASITVISSLWAIRLYFILVIFAYARVVLRRHIAQTSWAAGYQINQAPDAAAGSKMATDPFAVGSEMGAGWRGRLSRAMIRMPRDYWLGGTTDDEEWARNVEGRLNSKRQGSTPDVPPGPFERERRRRAGTGPPPEPQQKPVELENRK